MDRYELDKIVKEAEGLSNEVKSELLNYIRSHKKFGLVWEDKPEDAEQKMLEELPVLTEVINKSIISNDEEAPNHILIEGDNLQVLASLAYTHDGKIDVIYIDPPYNTGNKDFAYNDQYLRKEDEYRHSTWLSFMEKRLKLAKKLLSLNGVIFISIDDNEQAHLKLLCDEVFGASNCLATLIWKSKSGGANDASSFGIDHEYILCYSIRNTSTIYNDKDAIVTTCYNKVDSDGRRYSLDRLDKQSLGYQPSLDFPITGPDGKVYIVEHKDPTNKKARWRWGKTTVEERYDELVFIYPYVYTKNYEKNDGQKPRSILFDDRFGRTRTGSTDLFKVLGNQSIFDYPKPISLIKYLLSISAAKEAVILDFFAGSGTTLHATMQLNEEDGGHRQCILVTNNENNICEDVTYQRNKRVINGYTTPKGEEVEGLKNNSLRYYKTDFVPRDQTAKNMRELMSRATDMLCIKNDIYTESKFAGKDIHPDLLRYFENDEKQMLVIYNEEAIHAIVSLMQTIEPRDEKMLVYVFSPSSDPWSDDFEDVAGRVKLCALPSAILETYKKILPKRKPKFLDEALAELQREAEEQGELFNQEEEA